MFPLIPQSAFVKGLLERTHQSRSWCNLSKKEADMTNYRHTGSIDIFEPNPNGGGSGWLLALVAVAAMLLLLGQCVG